MGTQVTVEISDLRGYADVVDDMATYLGRASGYADTHCNATDFGLLLDPLASDYSALLPRMKTLLSDQVALMKANATAIDQTLQDFLTTDAQEAERHGGQATITDDGTSASYYGNPLTEFGSPTPDESDLPEIDFGFPFDQLAWALEKICGYDVRREVTDYLAGDVVEVSRQSNAWYMVGSATGSYSWCLRNANVIVARTWTGDAAESTIQRMDEWKESLDQQGTDFHQVGAHLADIAADAVDMAQLAVDLIKYAIDLIAAAWSSQWIPVYGQAKFVKKAWDAYQIVKKAWDKISEFLDVLNLVLSSLEIIYSSLNPVELPAAPSHA
ncbi:hypothetical protein EUA93_09195 [Nocardioides oleivorans]|uniref:WXG100 family type VII secretion target n=1 Tax=Nocardioides oleivorans TaxID=273676 RepID=A0A4V1RL45_9ACTN|nr:hypothetical protein [Nocardioides oleivorans]RYB94502.1 hypothetical protein EUA93_09195 [Nocardioides oleivorans]